MLDAQILVVIIILKCLFLFSRKTSPEQIPGDAEGAESRVRLQETSASGSLNGKLVKLHQIGVNVVTEVEIIILYSVLCKGRMNAMEMLRKCGKILKKKEMSFLWALIFPQHEFSCALPPVSLYSLTSHMSVEFTVPAPSLSEQQRDHHPSWKGKGWKMLLVWVWDV